MRRKPMSMRRFLKLKQGDQCILKIGNRPYSFVEAKVEIISHGIFLDANGTFKHQVRVLPGGIIRKGTQATESDGFVTEVSQSQLYPWED